tara:strand:+ start:565 stop:1002 length:438 start_codon:yes stop_codon:yes gene_type:complete
MRNDAENKQSHRWTRIFNNILGVMGHGRVENIGGNFTPDYQYCIDGINGWIEFKVYKLGVRRRVGKIKWSQGQRDWMKERIGCPSVFLIVEIGDYDFIFDIDSMFTFEGNSYEYLVNNHDLKIRREVYPSKDELLKIGNKLKGVR